MVPTDCRSLWTLLQGPAICAGGSSLWSLFPPSRPDTGTLLVEVLHLPWPAAPRASVSAHTLTTPDFLSPFVFGTLGFLSFKLSYALLKKNYKYLHTFLGVSGRRDFRLYRSTTFLYLEVSI